LTAAGDEISDEARALAARVRGRAAALPAAGDLAGMTADALTSPRSQTLSPDEIRQLAAEALTQAQQVAYLLGKLAVLLCDDPRDT
jgi:hypothetical protein